MPKFQDWFNIHPKSQSEFNSHSAALFRPSLIDIVSKCFSLFCFLYYYFSCCREVQKVSLKLLSMKQQENERCDIQISKGLTRRSAGIFMMILLSSLYSLIMRRFKITCKFLSFQFEVLWIIEAHEEFFQNSKTFSNWWSTQPVSKVSLFGRLIALWGFNDHEKFVIFLLL